jgi:hypothetical protein
MTLIKLWRSGRWKQRSSKKKWLFVLRLSWVAIFHMYSSVFGKRAKSREKPAGNCHDSKKAVILPPHPLTCHLHHNHFKKSYLSLSTDYTKKKIWYHCTCLTPGIFRKWSYFRSSWSLRCSKMDSADRADIDGSPCTCHRKLCYFGNCAIP